MHSVLIMLVLELGLWGNCGKALPCTLPHLPAGMFPGGRELRKDERGAPGMAGMQTNKSLAKDGPGSCVLMEGA